MEHKLNKQILGINLIISNSGKVNKQNTERSHPYPQEQQAISTLYLNPYCSASSVPRADHPLEPADQTNLAGWTYPAPGQYLPGREHLAAAAACWKACVTTSSVGRVGWLPASHHPRF